MYHYIYYYYTYFDNIFNCIITLFNNLKINIFNN